MNHTPLLLWAEIGEEGETSWFFIALLSLFFSLMFATVTKKNHRVLLGDAMENAMKFQNGWAAVFSFFHGTKKCQAVECETLPQSVNRMDIALSSERLLLRSFVFGWPCFKGILKTYFMSAKTDCFVCRWHVFVKNLKSPSP